MQTLDTSYRMEIELAARLAAATEQPARELLRRIRALRKAIG